MAIGYRLAYRFGITPWEAAGAGGRQQLDELLDREQADHPSRGRALDLGCGRGTHSIELAERGWEVTGVDFVPRAIVEAQRRAAVAGVKVSFVNGDVTDLPAAVGRGYQFVLDVGCFHGLTDPERIRFGRQLDVAAGAGATLLLLAFAPGGRGPLPRGAGPDDLLRALPHWTMLDQQAAETSGMPRALRSRAPQIYRLRYTPS